MGTRRLARRVTHTIRDHPHAYGDKATIRNNNTDFGGSSPRVWGQVNLPPKECKNCRIIPTRMGTSQKTLTAFLRCKDHPHAYGDKLRITNNTATRTRSSPRVWGQVHTDTNVLQKRRIIPTRMGTRLRIFRSLDTC